MTAVSLVVVAFHRPEALDRLLESVAGFSAEVVVVVVDGDPVVRAVAVRHGARAVSLPGNPGYAAAVNAGVRAATGSVLVFSNDDLRFEAGALDALVDVVHRTGDVVVPQMIDRAGAVEPTIAALATPGRLLLEWALLPDAPVRWLPRSLAAKWRRPAELEKVPAAMAAVVAARADLLHSFPLPECYFLYWEEQEWFWLLRDAGVSVWYEPASSVVHDGGRNDVRGEKSALLAGNAIRYIRRTQGRRAALLAWPVVLLWSARLMVVDGLRARWRPSAMAHGRVRARRAGFRAALRGLGDVVAR
ncbi:MAG: glycosyltransferase [Acidimicrobiales bacterium]|nr:glycosyltransferase [Acidimicrobiales bacterium]